MTFLFKKFDNCVVGKFGSTHLGLVKLNSEVINSVSFFKQINIYSIGIFREFIMGNFSIRFIVVFVFQAIHSSKNT